MRETVHIPLLKDYHNHPYLYAALESSLFPPLESQRLTLEEFVAGYCMEDFRHGHIDLVIDHEGRSVETTVELVAERGLAGPACDELPWQARG